MVKGRQCPVKWPPSLLYGSPVGVKRLKRQEELGRTGLSLGTVRYGCCDTSGEGSPIQFSLQ